MLPPGASKAQGDGSSSSFHFPVQGILRKCCHPVSPPFMCKGDGSLLLPLTSWNCARFKHLEFEPGNQCVMDGCLLTTANYNGRLLPEFFCKCPSLLPAVAQEIQLLAQSLPSLAQVEFNTFFSSKVKAWKLAKVCSVSCSSLVIPWEICTQVTWLEISTTAS